MNILFSRNDGSPDLTFVEVENDKGQSISVGEWSERDGYAVLTIPDAVPQPPSRQGMAPFSASLADVLAEIEQHDTDYDTRYQLVMHAVCRAVDAGYPAGFRIDPAEPGWPVAYIELPTGQVSWHMPQHPFEWDGHTTPDKYKRIKAYVQGGDHDGTSRTGV